MFVWCEDLFVGVIFLRMGYREGMFLGYYVIRNESRFIWKIWSSFELYSFFVEKDVKVKMIERIGGEIYIRDLVYIVNIKISIV